MRLAQIGPLWISILLDLRLFPSRQTAERRLRTLERAGRLRYAGRVSLDGRKPMHLWCNRSIRPAMLRHELDVMRVFYAFWPHAFARTGGEVNPRWRADLELTIGPPEQGRTYMVEVDEDTEPLGPGAAATAGVRGLPAHGADRGADAAPGGRHAPPDGQSPRLRDVDRAVPGGAVGRPLAERAGGGRRDCKSIVILVNTSFPRF